MIARVHAAAALHVGATVSAVASRDPRRAVALTQDVGGQAVLYDELPAGADAVAVCTPPALHLHHTRQMLEAGATVIVEKPLCTTLEDADHLCELARGRRVLYGENLLHAPVVREFLNVVGTLGTPTHLEVRAMQGAPTWGEFTTEEWGGGALFDLGAHPLAVALAAAEASGAGDAVSVSAEMRGGPSHRSDEHAEVVVQFASGLRAHVMTSWQAGPAPVWDAQMSSDTGVVRAEILPVPSLERNGEPCDVAADPVSGPIGELGFAAQIRVAFAADAGTETYPTVSFGRRVLDVTCGAYLSARRGGAPTPLPYAGPRDQTPLQILRG